VKISKRCAVRNAHGELLKLFQELVFHHTKRVSGAVLIRICCRTFEQLQDILSATEIVFQKNLIAEIGMPLEHNYKMKTLVMHLKPVNTPSAIEIYDIFNKRSCAYHVLLLKSSTSEMEEKKCLMSSAEKMHILARLNPILNVFIIILGLFLIQYFSTRFIS